MSEAERQAVINIVADGPRQDRAGERLMPSQKEPFNAKQLAWCKERLPGFSRSFTDRTRADESAEISNRRARGVYPGEFIGFRNENRTENTAVTVRHGYSTGPSAKLVPQHRGRHAWAKA